MTAVEAFDEYVDMLRDHDWIELMNEFRTLVRKHGTLRAEDVAEYLLMRESGKTIPYPDGPLIFIDAKET